MLDDITPKIRLGGLAVDHQNRVALALVYIVKTNAINGGVMPVEGVLVPFPVSLHVLCPLRRTQRDGELYGIRGHGRQIQGKAVAISG